MLQACPN